MITQTGRKPQSEGDACHGITILATKLGPPQLRRKWVDRSHLISRLREGQQRRLTLISAPAGFGKTTLATQWVRSQPAEAAWISLDESEDRLDVFVTYFLQAIRTVVPSFAVKVDRFLSAQILPPPDILAAEVVSELKAVDQRVLLILDDYHTIHSDQIHSFVERLVEWTPENFHLVVLTRSDPPWALARWRVSEWMNEFRASDLRFTLEETVDFFHRAGSHQTPDSILGIYERTEGWIASLQLLQLSSGQGKSGEGPSGQSGQKALVYDYLMEEIVSRQPPEIQEFFFLSSLLDRFCAPLCDRLLGDGEGAARSQDIIARLERENQFLVPLDEERCWYRYHHLFHDLLRKQLRLEESPERVSRLHCRAGEWLADQELIEEALAHFIAAGEFGRAAELVEEHMHETIDRDISRRQLGRWIELFPPSELDRYPSLLVARSYVAIASWELQTASSLLDCAEQLLLDPVNGLPADRRRSLEGDIAANRAMCRFFCGDPDGAISHGRAAQPLIPKSHRYARNNVAIYTAGGYMLAGRRDKALQVLGDALTDEPGSGDEHSAPLLYARAVVDYFGGELAESVAHGGQVLALDEVVGVSDYWCGSVRQMIALCEYERNNLDAASKHLSIVETMRYRANSRSYHDCLIGLALVALAEGDEGRAREFADSARRIATKVGAIYSLAISDSFEARLDLMLGKRRSTPPASVNVFHGNKWYFELPPLTQAEYWLADPTPDACRAALEVIEQGLQDAKRCHHICQTVQFLVVKSLALWHSGRQEGALATLDSALELARPRGFIRTFVDRGRGMIPLLEDAASRTAGDEYLKSLLEAFTVRPATTAPATPLSNREMSVLALLANRLSNKEIAAQLGISPVTVKRHTINIYRKLEVNGRRAAVATARRLNLLPTWTEADRAPWA